MPVHGDTVLPSADTNTPDVPPPDSRHFLTPEEFGFRREDGPYAPKEVAGRLRVSSDEILGLIEEGVLLAFPVRSGKRTTYRVPYTAIAVYFLRQQGADS
jgi:hypothetical protein